MFGMFKFTKNGPTATSAVADSTEKKERGALQMIKGFLGLNAGRLEIEDPKKKSPEVSTRKASKKNKHNSKKTKPKKKKTKSPPSERVKENTTGVTEDRTEAVDGNTTEEQPLPEVPNTALDEDVFLDCYNDIASHNNIICLEEEEEEDNLSCFATPPSSPLQSRTNSKLYICDSEGENDSSGHSESGFTESMDEYRSTTPEQKGTESSFADCSDDSSTEMSDKLFIQLPSSLTDSGISSVPTSSLCTPLDFLPQKHFDQICVNTLARNLNAGSESDDKEVANSANEDVEEPEEIESQAEVLTLQHEWTLFYDSQEGRPKGHFSNYISHVQQVITVNTVERFWSLYNHILSPAELTNSSNLHFFKSGIRPMWEDPSNSQGGKWVLTIKNQPELLNKIWLEILLSLIGDQFEKPNQICGAVVSRRKKGDRIALWTSNKERRDNIQICKGIVKILYVVKQVGKQKRSKFLKELARGGTGVTLVYMHHMDALQSGSSYQNSAHIKVEDCIEDLLKV